MTEKRTDSYSQKRRRKGFTLVELLSALAILSILVSVSIPAAADVVNDAKKKCCISETVLVRIALQTYLTEQLEASDISFISHDGLDEKIYESVLYPCVDEKENALYEMLAGNCTPGGRIIGMGYNMATGRITDIIYRAGGMEVEIKGKKETTVRKVTEKQNSRNLAGPGIS